MAEIVYRRSEPSEAGAICEFMARQLTGSFSSFPAQAIADYLRSWTPEAVSERSRARTDVLLSARSADDLIGIVSGNAPEGGVGTVIWLLVAEPWRGRGVGRALFERACDAYRALGAHKLKLTAPSRRAASFYEGCGMNLEGVHPNHWYGLEFFSLGIAIR